MDNLILDADSLFAMANIIDSYCARQRETINVYYSQIMALEYEWHDDDTFGAIAKEISELRRKTLVLIDEIYNNYPKYFRDRAKQILERPTINNKESKTIKVTDKLTYTTNINDNIYVLSNADWKDVMCDADNLSTYDSPHNFQKDAITLNKNMKKNCPNTFSKTNQVWKYNKYIKIFNSPNETGSYLNSNQGIPEKMGGEGVEGFEGTCGLVCCENILRMAGVNINESEIVKYAKSHKRGFRYLCTVDSEPENNGGTYPKDRQKILKHFGIESEIEYTTDIEKIANYVSEGRGVIASVDACTLWFEFASAVPMGHAITITSVEKDIFSGEITAFYICDSGNGDSSRRIRADLLCDAMRLVGGCLNITSTIIR